MSYDYKPRIQAHKSNHVKKIDKIRMSRTVITGISGWWDTRDFLDFPSVTEMCALNSEDSYFVYVSTCLEGTVGLISGWPDSDCLYTGTEWGGWGLLAADSV